MTRVLLTLARPGPREVARREAYLTALQRAGAQVLPLFPGETPPDDFDALCLSGGGDVHPRYYGEEIAGSDRIDEERDALEFALVERALRARRPVLGVCRGMQVLNVALGGRLTQHLEGHDPRRGGELMPHEIVIAPGSLLAASCGRGPFRVNTWHHQGVHPRDLARGALATTVVGDLVEAFEAPHFGWVVGVQWHPERASEVDPAATRIFDGFVLAARGDPAPTHSPA